MPSGQYEMVDQSPKDQVLLKGTDDTPAEIIRRGDEALHRGEPFYLLDGPPQLETPQERRSRRKSHLIIYATTFIMCVGFSIVLTGLWPYLKKLDKTAKKESLGWIVAVNPLGQMLFSPVLGWYANKFDANRSAFVMTIVFSIIGSILYALLPLVKDLSRILILVARFIVGLSSANIAVCRSYIVSSTKMSERTAGLSATAAAQAIGFILGPSLQSAVAIGFKTSLVSDNSTVDDSDPLLVDGVPWNMYSAVGWLGTLLCIVNLTFFLPCVFKEYNIAEKEAKMNKENATESKMNLKMPKPDYPAVCLVVFTFFLSQMIFLLMQTLLVPMTMDLYSFHSDFSIFVVGIGLSVLAVLAFLMIVIVGILSKKKVEDRKMHLFMGFIPLTIGVLILFPIGTTYPTIQTCDPLARLDNTSIINNNYVSTGLGGNASLSNNLTEPIQECIELGCPASQTWCEYTPIIYKSQLGIGLLLAFIGYPVGYSVSSSLLSKLLGPSPQGFWMGILTSFGGLAKIVGPLFATYTYSLLGPQWVFGLLFALLLITTIIISLFYKRLVPMKIDKNENTHVREDEF